MENAIDRYSLSKPPPGVAKALETVDEWSYDIFALGDATKNKPLKYLASYLFNRYGIIEKFKISVTTLETFLNCIEEGYCRFRNPYHNNLHAADVTQTIHFMLCQTGLKDFFTDLEIFAIFLATIIHDYDHSGTTNNFQIITGSEKALIYNDLSVQENHHISAAFFLLKEDACNILLNLSREEYRQLRGLIVDMILSTDMDRHFELIKDVKCSIRDKKVDKKKVMAIMLHACDISNPFKEWKLHFRWSKLLFEEFHMQGDKERELGLPISSLCDRNKINMPDSQLKFMNFISEPTMSLFGDLVDFVLEPIADQSKGAIDSIVEKRISHRKKFRISRPWAVYIAQNKKHWNDRAAKGIRDLRA